VPSYKLPLIKKKTVLKHDQIYSQKQLQIDVTASRELPVFAHTEYDLQFKNSNCYYCCRRWAVLMTIQPLKQIHHEGHLYKKALESDVISLNVQE
jgi:hypothetical protein